MPQESSIENLSLENSLLKADSGDRQILVDFFEAFLKGPLFVPDRDQLHTPLNIAQYPDEFLRVLAIQDKERIIVPVFSRADFAEIWANHPIKTVEYTGERLVRIIPEEWWICINPAQEVEKDLSPWEIMKLSDGKNSFDELIAEIQSEEKPNLLIVQAVTNMPELVSAICKDAIKYEIIRSIYIGKHQELETSKDSDEIILAIVVDDSAFTIRKEIKNNFESLSKPFLIGHGSLRVLVEEINQSVVLGTFRHIEPIYTSQSKPNSSIIRRAYGTFTNWFKKN